MSKNMLPYPGRNESFESWDRRCKEWESDRRSYNRYQHAGRGYAKHVASRDRGPVDNVTLACCSRWTLTEMIAAQIASAAGKLGSRSFASCGATDDYKTVPAAALEVARRFRISATKQRWGGSQLDPATLAEAVALLRHVKA